MTLALWENRALSATEQQRLDLLEEQVEQGCEMAAAAVRAIRIEGLYRLHGTWEQYCAARWGRSIRNIQRMLQAEEVMRDLTEGDKFVASLPAAESQLRALASVPPEERAATWQQAIETAPDGKVTAAAVAGSGAALD